MDRILFIGGPGNISSSCVNQLIKNGKKVAIFKRSQNVDPYFEDKVLFYTGDRNEITDLENAINNFKPNKIVDFVCFEPFHADQISSFVLNKVVQYIFVSTVDVYGYPLSCIPMKEEDEKTKTTSPYAEKKRKCEELLRKKEKEKGLPLTIVRPTYSFGVKSGMLSFFEWDGMKYQVPRIRAGLPVLVPGDGSAIIHTSCASNTGGMIACIIENTDKSIGKTYNCGHDSTLTFDEYIQIIGSQIGTEPILVHVPNDVLLSIDSDEIKNSFLPSLTRFNMSFSIEKFKKDFPDFKWKMSLEEGVNQYLNWYDKNKLFSEIGEEIYEDKIIRAWKKCLDNFQI